MITTLHADDTSALFTMGKHDLEGSKEMFGKHENSQHQKRGKSVNQISG